MVQALSSLPQWFAAIFATVYLSGYLVSVAFYSQFGLSDADLDFLKLKYVHTGIIFNSALLIIGVVLYFFFFRWIERYPGRNSENATQQTTPMHLFDATAILMWLLLLTTYVASFFFPPRYFFESPWKWWLLFTAIFLCTVGYAILQYFSDRLKISDASGNVLNDVVFKRLLYFVCLVVLLLDIAVAWDVAPRFAEMFKLGVYFFLLLAFLITFIFWRTLARIGAFSPQYQIQYWALTLSIVGLLYYTAALSFAYGVYPYVPVTFGGGDFEFAPDVTFLLQADDDTKGLIANYHFLGSATQTNPVSKPLKIILRTDSRIYVADPCDAGGPAAWRARAKYPKVLGIRTDQIVGILSEGQSAAVRCP
jgi:hypothetical protein